MKMVVRQSGNIWKAVAEDDSDILNVSDLICFIESNGYSVNQEGQALYIEGVPSSDNLCSIIQGHYGDLAEIYPF